MIDKIVKDIPTQLFENKRDIQEKLNYYRELSKKGLDLLSETEIEELKIEFNKFLNLNLALISDAYPSRLFRVTNNKQLTGGQMLKLQKITDLLAPPKEKSSIGRCNLQGERVFYAALDLSTAIWETQPQVKDYITVSEWKIKEGQKLYTDFIFNPHQTNLSQESQNAYAAHLKLQQEMDPSRAEIFTLLLKFACDEFMKPVDNKKKVNYLFSSIISSRFLQAPLNNNELPIEAICYPSIKLDHKVTNMAILNSLVLERLDLITVTVYYIADTNYDEVNKNRGDLVKFHPVYTVAKDFDFVNDKIHYDSKKELELMMEFRKKTKREPLQP